MSISLIVILLTRLRWPWLASGEHRLWWALGVTAAFATLGYAVRGVTRSGALAGGLVCFALLAGAGPGAFYTLLVLFLLTWLATRMGRARKERLGTAERGTGRNASQVLANLAAAVACAILFRMRGDAGLLLGMTAAIAEAGADTVSSECGQAFRETAVLITTFETVPAGTDGGISLTGTLAGALAAGVIATTAWLAGLVSSLGFGISVVAALLGMLADSYLGAQFERRGVLDNDVVNFLGTLVSVVFSLILIRLVS